MIDRNTPAEDFHATISIQDNVAKLTLNRPRKRNSISIKMLDDIETALETARKSKCRVLVIKGAGGNFCAGADLTYVSGLLDETPELFADEFIPHVQRVMNKIEDLPIPVVAAVEGFCLAGGFELMLCCDIVFAKKSAQIADGHSVFGFLPGSGGAYRLTRKAGINRANYIAFSGDMFSADDMLAMGLVTKVCEDDTLDEDVDKFSATLASRSPIGLQRMKELIQMSDISDRHSGLKMEQVASAAHVKTYDMAEGLAAFAEKRKPAFKGQ